MELELETAARETPSPVSEASMDEQAEIKLCRIDDPSCEACQ
jgi:hypothetical protein